MKIYFEDDYLVLGRYAPDFNFVIDAAAGPRNNEKLLRFYLKTVPDCSVYTNSLIAVHNMYCWNKELGVPELYIRKEHHGDWFRVDQLTNRELREGHNLEKMYLSGGFSHDDTWRKSV